MSIEVKRVIVCDSCGERSDRYSDWADKPGANAVEQRKWLSLYWGWTLGAYGFDGTHPDLCRPCTEHAAEQVQIEQVQIRGAK